MKYLTLSGGCLLTILIPLNFAIGCYTLHMKELGRKKLIIDIIVSIIGGIITALLIKQKYDPYISSILATGILVGLIQSNVMYRKTEKLQIENNWAEKMLAVMRLAIYKIADSTLEIVNSKMNFRCKLQEIQKTEYKEIRYGGRWLSTIGI